MDDDFKQVCAPGWNDDQRAIASDSTEPAAKRNALHRINQRLVVERDRLADEVEALRRERSDLMYRIDELEVRLTNVYRDLEREWKRAEAAEAAEAKVAELEERVLELEQERDVAIERNGESHGLWGRFAARAMLNSKTAESALAAERERVERLREALKRAYDCLITEDMFAAGSPLDGEILAALAQEEAHE